MDLHIDSDDLNSCVQCGLCLPHCPTFRVSGDELLSPRGRIRLMREVQNNEVTLTDDIVESFETCVLCRGCEPACPSGVPYGRMMEHARETLVTEGRASGRLERIALRQLSRPRLLAAGTKLLAIAQRLRLVPRRLGIGSRIPLRQPPLRATGEDVLVFTGCVMDTMQRDVHLAVIDILEDAGFGATPTGALAPCCGALHTHAGMGDDARSLAQRTIEALAGDAPIVVDSAGCGAAMKDYGRLLGTSDAAAFSARVVDVNEFLAEHVDRLPTTEPLDLAVGVQDPCHLRHVQGVHGATRTLLAPFVRSLVELDDDGLCCGAGGAYSVLQPDLAGDIRDRKIASIGRAAPDIVASANPGCSMYLAAGGIETVHPIQLVHRAIRGQR